MLGILSDKHGIIKQTSTLPRPYMKNSDRVYSFNNIMISIQ